MEWFAWWFDGSAFLTRSHCGVWPHWLIGAYQFGNMLTALSYFLIPVMLLAVYLRRRQLGLRSGVGRRFQAVIVWFTAFIFLCGLTHACDVLVFWWAPYRLFTVICLLTGLVSIYVTMRLPWLVREVWDMVPPELLYAEIERVKAAKRETEEARKKAEAAYRRIREEVHALHGIAWRENAEERLKRIATILSVLDEHTTTGA